MSAGGRVSILLGLGMSAKVNADFGKIVLASYTPHELRVLYALSSIMQDFPPGAPQVSPSYVWPATRGK